jgi:hypothetical protein
VPGIRIIRGDEHPKLQRRSFDLPFGDQQDGTKLVLEFLEQARKAGARYVSDIRIVVVSQRGDRTRRCATRLLPFAKKESYKVPHQIPGRTETRMVPKLVTQMVTEYQTRCKMVSVPVTRMETTYQYQYDYMSKSTRSVPVTRMVTSYQYQNKCSSQPVTRTVSRYEYQMQTRYIPPQLTYLSAHYTDFDLVESTPTCEPTTSADGKRRLPHRITATIYLEKKVGRK